MNTPSKDVTFIKGTGNTIRTVDRGEDAGSGGRYTTVGGTGIIIGTWFWSVETRAAAVGTSGVIHGAKISVIAIKDAIGVNPINDTSDGNGCFSTGGKQVKGQGSDFGWG
jgi:hypothetical protein